MFVITLFNDVPSRPEFIRGLHPKYDGMKLKEGVKYLAMIFKDDDYDMSDPQQLIEIFDELENIKLPKNVLIIPTNTLLNVGDTLPAY